ncbi:zinc-binding alcohol dehydrogenase family protein [Paenibacillus sp. HJGM_3]|uniref:zinc-binding alcohol dehydrogenase family protein n=1 Tax=Paenibacillus sp. HJGM_3 TaxID=3379816 RepID=UPI00385E4190
MKGIVCERVEELRYVELPEPTAPGPDEVVVRIRRIGICGTDLHAYRGRQPFFTYPRVLGHELAGTVETMGSAVSGLAVGDTVSIVPYLHCGTCIACRRGRTNCCVSLQVLGVHVDGGMRERLVVPASHVLRAGGLTLDQAAMLEPLSIGAHAVRRSGLAAGDVALVIGAGPIGLGVMAFAKHRGATVIAMDVKDERLAYCRRWAQADFALNAAEPEAKAQLEAMSGGDLPTVVFDATGNARSMEQAFGLAAHGGTLVLVGLVKSDLAFHDPEFHKRELTLLASRNATLEDFALVREAVASGRIDVDGYITHRAPFESMIERFDEWLRPESQVIKAVVTL